MTTGSWNRTASTRLAVIGLACIVSACAGGAGQGSPASSAAAPSQAAASPAPATTPAATASTAATTSATATADAGRILGKVLAGGSAPAYSVDALEGWSTEDGGFIVKAGPSVMGVSVWEVDRVPRDPCRWKAQLDRPGPTVDDLVQALVAQKTRNASTPTAVTIGGHSGMTLDWSVPADAVVTGDADFEGCDDPGNGHQDFVSWLPTGSGERYQQMAGQVDRLWVLDVDGQRLVIDGTYSPDATEADRDSLDRLVQSLEFTTP